MIIITSRVKTGRIPHKEQAGWMSNARPVESPGQAWARVSDALCSFGNGMADESAPSDEAEGTLSNRHQNQNPEEIFCEYW
mmetsp:Transcript_3724/g.9319  ORF Transcript_3724/g.9319 Transcript_3724/m.9319 type:complete len:81 (+) Transcript_3724:939-1181(+)